MTRLGHCLKYLNMSKTLIWSDIHQRVDLLHATLDTLNPEKVIFLGDYWDDFGDSTSGAIKMAMYLRQLIEEHPDWVYLLGNHDMAYIYPSNDFELWCSGNTHEKRRAIRAILSQYHFDKFKLFHFEQGYLFSHAGIHYQSVGNVLNYPTDQQIPALGKLCKDTLENIKVGLTHPILGAGRSRGGDYPVGGITWLDWHEFDPIDGINQIVGHTPNVQPRIAYNDVKEFYFTADQVSNPYVDSMNYCLDTHNNHYAFIEDGKVTIHETAELYEQA